MNRLCSKIRFSSSLSLLLVLSIIPAVYAAETPLRPFAASYELRLGSSHIANTELKLERTGEHWRWSSLTLARGIYAWLTRKRPYSETRFSQAGGEIWLREILVTDARKEKNPEVARFDWGKGELDVLRKGKSKQLQLQAPVYDFLSIHLLVAAMGQRQLPATTVDFYRKGKLLKSRIVDAGRQDLDITGQTINAHVYEQFVSSPKSRLRYFYDAAHPLLPLRIEKFEAGEKPVVMTLRRVDWGSITE